MKYIQIPDDGVIEKQIMNGEDLVGVCRIDLSYLPAEDVMPVVHGKWIQTEYWKYKNKHSILYKTNRCSICNCDISKRLVYNYCPHCGAKMDGE